MEIVIKYKGKDTEKFIDMMRKINKKFKEKAKGKKAAANVEIIMVDERCWMFRSPLSLGFFGKTFKPILNRILKSQIKKIKEEFKSEGLNVDVEVKI